VKPLQWRYTTSDLKLFRTFDTAQIWHWLFAAIKKHLKGIHFTRDEEVQAATVKRF
jgi:hypothetical protein